MGRPRLSDVEKQWRKKKAADERARKRAEREAVREQLRLRNQRAKTFAKLIGGPFRLLYCLDRRATIRVKSHETCGYDELAQLAMLFNTTKINIGVALEENYDTFGEGGYDTGYVEITIEDVDWTKLDNV